MGVPVSSFHAYYTARQLSSLTYGNDKLLPTLASSNMEIYPYQLAAALFALRSPYLKGVVLCDEGGLGKTFEALLIVVQKWYEGRERILLTVPTHLIGQWKEVLEDYFTIPAFFIDSEQVWEAELKSGSANPFSQRGIVVTTYDFANAKNDALRDIAWDTTVFDEADALCHIYTGENKMATALKEAVADAYKILVTPTPILTDIRDIYGLIYFIDETALPDIDSFYERYFRKPENYSELYERVSKYCFRTLRSQVSSYVKLPRRIPIMAYYEPTAVEQELYNLVDTYLKKPVKIAYPQMDIYDLTLRFTRTLSSSTTAMTKLLEGVIERLKKQERTPVVDAELAEFERMAEVGRDIKSTAKGENLLAALHIGFAELKKLGAKKKALIFTESLTTQQYLFRLLTEHGYKALTFHGGKSRELTAIKNRFRDEADILITTDLAAKGPNFEFCSFVINYDLPYNTLTLDQRINRCHRKGQQSDVIVLSFINPNNYDDVRTLELINKRVLQFDRIFGMSDDVVGNFGADIGTDFRGLIASARTKKEIERVFQEAMSRHDEENKALSQQAEDMLFTSFSKEVADGVTITSQYIEDKSCELNAALWDVACWFFDRYNADHENGFAIDVQNHTITLQTPDEQPTLFYYWTGSHNKPYSSLKAYGMGDDYSPKSGRITLSSIIGRGILHELACPDNGRIVLDKLPEPCTVALYSVSVYDSNAPRDTVREYSILVCSGGRSPADS